MRSERVRPHFAARAMASRPRVLVLARASSASSATTRAPEYRAAGYRTFVDPSPSASATRVKIDCGPVRAYTGGRYDGDTLRAPWDSAQTTPKGDGASNSTTQRTYVFDATLAGASEVLSGTAARPLGIIFEDDADGRARVADFVKGSDAARANDVAALAPFGRQCARRGDVLRAFTATQVVYRTTAALTGDLSGTKRVRTLFGADEVPWGEVSAALANGRVADGPITLVLERDGDRERAENWPRREEELEFRGLGDESTQAKRQRERFESDEDTERANIAFAGAIAAFVLLILAGFS